MRLAPEVIRDDLIQTVFSTGDDDLDRMLNSARAKFFSPDLAIRKEGLEKLWDAWERLKTIEPPHNDDKRKAIENLLNKVSPEQGWRDELNAEGMKLTGIGNNFMIRHTEVGKTPINDIEEVDYLFQRMFALIHLLLQKTGRLSQ